MIKQKPELWPPEGDRPRRWHAFLPVHGGRVVLRHMAILGDGEELTEYPPTVELTWEEWQRHHSDYGLQLDGAPAEDTRS